MKILRKGDVFTKMNDSNLKDLKQIDSMVSSGWKFSPKQEYKNFYSDEKVTATEAKAEAKAVAKAEAKSVKAVKKEKKSKK